MSRLRRALTFANICSFLALVVALGTGGAYAANTVFSTDIVDGEVKTADIATDAVTSGKILDGTVKLADIKGADRNLVFNVAAGAVSNARCRDFNVVTPGAQVGDAVVMSIRGPVPPGIAFSGVRVSVDDTSIIKMCNLSGAPSPAIESLPIRVLTVD
jgi:hypothetical protein